MKLALSLAASVFALFPSEREVRATFGIVRVGTMTGRAQDGAQLSMTVGSPSLSFVGDLRAADAGTKRVVDSFTLGTVQPRPELSLGFASVSAGARHNFTENDFSPFVGGGLAVEAMTLESSNIVQKRTGLAGYGEVGLDVQRADMPGGSIGLRIDAPAFELDGRPYTPIVAAAFSLRL